MGKGVGAFGAMLGSQGKWRRPPMSNARGMGMGMAGTRQRSTRAPCRRCTSLSLSFPACGVRGMPLISQFEAMEVNGVRKPPRSGSHQSVRHVHSVPVCTKKQCATRHDAPPGLFRRPGQTHAAALPLRSGEGCGEGQRSSGAHRGPGSAAQSRTGRRATCGKMGQLQGRGQR